MKAPRFFSSSEGKEGYIQCGLCPSRCYMAPDREGLCGVRINRGGKPALPYYGFITALASDPIEKKPLYHWRPGTEILSAGFAGCNLRCPFCQNWHISQNIHAGGDTGTRGRFFSPGELVAMASEMRTTEQTRHRAAAIQTKHSPASQSLAYTYSEPLVHAEFLLDCMKEAREAGIANVLVSNGCVNSEAAAEILKLTDAANIDLKCFSEETYSKTLGGNLSAVKEFIRMAVEKGVHLEITTLVVPGLNDSRAELDMCRDFIAELQSREKAVPWHLSAYHPDYKWDAPATQPAFLTGAAKRASEKLAYVYTGNIAARAGTNFSDTFCPHCGELLVSRLGYMVDTSGLSLNEDNGKPVYFCAKCGGKAPIAW